jgi:hypothetical protein
LRHFLRSSNFRGACSSAGNDGNESFCHRSRAGPNCGSTSTPEGLGPWVFGLGSPTHRVRG